MAREPDWNLPNVVDTKTKVAQSDTRTLSKCRLQIKSEQGFSRRVGVIMGELSLEKPRQIENVTVWDYENWIL